MTTSYALEAEGISKTYGATKALDDVSLAVSTGTIHGLMGGNGSGKSTFIKILAGVVTPDGGRLAIAGEWVDARSHNSAKAKTDGLHFVHQQNSTFPDLTVAENIALGRGFEQTALGSISWREQHRRAREVLARFEINAKPETPIVRLSAANQMMVAIARALQDQDETEERGILVLDEPTASLPKHEVDLLLTALRRYAADGQTIVYVSHRLEEVTAIADQVTVLRNGRVASRLAGEEITHDALVAGITGKDPSTTGSSARPPALSDVSADALLTLDRQGQPSEHVEVRSGEIVAVAGLLGSGRSRLLKQIFGVLPRPGLDVVLSGADLPAESVGTAMRRGIAFVPENRLAEAAFPELSIAENISITCLSKHSLAGWIKQSRERRAARQLIEEFGVRAPTEVAPLTALSGGNQQKVILARWLATDPQFLILDEPTRGIDVGAHAEIIKLIEALCAEGLSLLVISSELEELLAYSARVVVLRDRRHVAELSGEAMTTAHIVEAIASQASEGNPA